jgi:predicted amidohydrolase YtcJ
MDKVRHPTAPDGIFVDGNPLMGVVPTRITAEHQNALQEEVVNAIKAAGITPAHDDNTQLAQAIRQLSGDVGSNYGVRIARLTAADILSPDDADDINALFSLEQLPYAPTDGGIVTTPI